MSTGQLPVLRLYVLPYHTESYWLVHETFPNLPVYLFLDAATHTPEVAFMHIPITTESLTVFVDLETTRQPRNPAHFWHITG